MIAKPVMAATVMGETAMLPVTAEAVQLKCQPQDHEVAQYRCHQPAVVALTRATDSKKRFNFMIDLIDERFVRFCSLWILF
jgi:hypothetical protein